METKSWYRPGAFLTLQRVARASYQERMPWKASSVMEEKLRFVLEYERDEQTMRELCRSFGIARETGYVWLRRYRERGPVGLLELNRAAQRHPNQTPASVYAPSPRPYPARVPEPEYPSTMLVRSVHAHGHFRGQKRHDIFLSEVLWGERVGLLPIDERWYTVYFAALPLARFDSWRRRVMPLPPEKNPRERAQRSRPASTGLEQGRGSIPFPAPPSSQTVGKTVGCARSQNSGMSPAIQTPLCY